MRSLLHSIRTALATVVSLIVSDLLRLPESYWAPLTTIVVLQSTLEATLPVSIDRFFGTAIGAVLGAIVATFFAASAVVVGLSIFAAGMVCAALGTKASAYRFAGLTVLIVLFVRHNEPAWVTAIHRFIEVALGITVGLLMTFVWPEKAPAGVKS